MYLKQVGDLTPEVVVRDLPAGGGVDGRRDNVAGVLEVSAIEL